MSRVEEFVAATATTKQLFNDATLPEDQVDSVSFKGILSQNIPTITTIQNFYNGWASDGNYYIRIIEKVFENGVLSGENTSYKDKLGNDVFPYGFRAGDTAHGPSISKNITVNTIATSDTGSIIIIEDNQRFNKVSGYTMLSVYGTCIYKTAKTTSAKSFLIPASVSPIEFQQPKLSEGDYYTYFNIISTSSTGSFWLGITGYTVDIAIPITLSLKTGLRYATGGTLGAEGVIPSTSPYGTGEVFSGNPNTNPNIVDWVLVQTRNGSRGNISQSISGILLSNGNIVSPLNTALPLTVSNNGECWVSIKHRNHVAIISANKIDTSQSSTLDMTIPANVDGMAGTHYMVSGGIAYMAPGDVDQNLFVEAADASAVATASGSNAYGYVPEDINLDAFVDNLDVGIVNANVTAGYYSKLVDYSVIN